MARYFQHAYTAPVTALRWSVGLQASPEEAQSQAFWKRLTEGQGGIKGLRSLMATDGFDRWLRDSRLLDKEGRVWTVWGFLAASRTQWAQRAITVLSQAPGFEPPKDDEGVTTAKGAHFPLSVLWRLRAFDATQPLDDTVLDALIAHNRLDPAWRGAKGETFYHVLAQASPFSWRTDTAEPPQWRRIWDRATQGLPADLMHVPQATLGRQHPATRALERVLRCLPESREPGDPGWTWDRVMNYMNQQPSNPGWGLWAQWAGVARGRDLPVCHLPVTASAEANLPWALGVIPARDILHIQHPKGSVPQVSFGLVNALKAYQGGRLDAGLWQQAAHAARMAGVDLTQVVVVGPDGSRWSWHGHAQARDTTPGEANRFFLNRQKLACPHWVWADAEGIRRPLSHAVALDLDVEKGIDGLAERMRCLHIEGLGAETFDWSARAEDGSTLMHVVARAWPYENVEAAAPWLLDWWQRRGVDMTALDSRGRSCLDILEERLNEPGVAPTDARGVWLRQAWQPWATRIAQLRLQQAMPEEDAAPRPRPRF